MQGGWKNSARSVRTLHSRLTARSDEAVLFGRCGSLGSYGPLLYFGSRADEAVLSIPTARSCNATRGALVLRLAHKTRFPSFTSARFPLAVLSPIQARSRTAVLSRSMARSGISEARQMLRLALQIRNTRHRRLALATRYASAFTGSLSTDGARNLHGCALRHRCASR